MEEGGIPLFLSFYCILKLHPNHIVSGFCYSFQKMTYMRRKNAANRTLCQTLRCFAAPQLAAFLRHYLRIFFTFAAPFAASFMSFLLSHEVSCLRHFFALYK